MSEPPTITQEMINLYDEYTHVTLDRRDFMQKLAKLAGGTAAATTIASMIASNYALAQTVSPDDRRLAVEDVTFPGPAGDIFGYLAKPADAAGPLPSVVVVHENRGLNPHIKDVTRRMGLEGFLALGVDLLSRQGGTPPTDEEAAPMFRGIDQAALVEDAIAAIVYLKDRPDSNGKVGAIGFCFGGGIVNQMAVHSSDLLAAVPYYGAQPSAEDAAMIRARIMAHFAGLDERTNAGMDGYDAALTAAGVDHQFFVYDGANHAFNNDTGARYDQAAADLAWTRTIAFLKDALA